MDMSIDYLCRMSVFSKHGVRIEIPGVKDYKRTHVIKYDDVGAQLLETAMPISYTEDGKYVDNIYRIKELNSKIIFDFMGEPAEIPNLKLFYGWLKKHNLKLNDTVLISMNTIFPLKNHIEFDPVIFSAPTWGTDFDYGNDFNFNKSRKFLNMNGTAKPHRIWMINEIAKRKIDKYGFISLMDRPADQITTGELRHELGSYLYNHISPESLINNIMDDFQDSFFSTFKYNLEDHSYDTALAYTPPSKYIVDNSYFSIVSETQYFKNDGIYFVTEKTWKSLLFHPVIFLTTPKILKVVKRFGIQTFPELFDESYDEIEDDYERLKFVASEVERVSKMSSRDLNKIFKDSIIDKVRFNRNLLLNFDQQSYINKFYNTLKNI